MKSEQMQFVYNQVDLLKNKNTIRLNQSRQSCLRCCM